MSAGNTDMALGSFDVSILYWTEALEGLGIGAMIAWSNSWAVQVLAQVSGISEAVGVAGLVHLTRSSHGPT